VIREFMLPFTKADEDSIRIANEAIVTLTRLGAEIVDPGATGQLFKEAIAELVPTLDSMPLTSTFKDFFGGGDAVEKLVAVSLNHSPVPPEATLRWLVDAEAPSSGESMYALNRYLQARADRKIRDIRSFIDNSVFYEHALIDGVTAPLNGRLESNLVTTQRWTKKDDGTPFTQKSPIRELDIRAGVARRVVLQALILKVMADHRLDALVYPTKNIPAPILAAPLEPTNLKTVSETVTATLDGVEYTRKVERALDTRDPLAWRLSAASGLPAIAVPAGFTREVYDRAAVLGQDGSKKAGALVGPKPIALPVSIDFLGRPFSEPVLLGIAAAFEKATHHRRAPKSFGPLPGEP
jgi:Asp-tRNA(Asn)/Glu-tRNA(Gln) amidotransferase A subunit family amidase